LGKNPAEVDAGSKLIDTYKATGNSVQNLQHLDDPQCKQDKGQ